MAKKKKSQRCQYCNKKLKHMIFNCKCHYTKLCITCLKPHIHKCTFDSKKEQKEKLKKELKDANFIKIHKI